MQRSHSHQTRRAKSMTNNRKNLKSINSPIKETDNQIKIDTIFNFYNNITPNSDIEMDESTLGDIEYAKTLQMALRDAINQNEKLTEELNKCIQKNKELREEIEEKDNVIYELSQYYKFCQSCHMNNNSEYNDNSTKNSNNNSIEIKAVSKKRRNMRSGNNRKRNKCFPKPAKEN